MARFAPPALKSNHIFVFQNKLPAPCTPTGNDGIAAATTPQFPNSNGTATPITIPTHIVTAHGLGIWWSLFIKEYVRALAEMGVNGEQI
jgi:hypothetical protein